jgi:hypothetical protein
VARVLATAAVKELRDRDIGKAKGIVEFAVREQATVRCNPRAVEFELDAAIESGSQRGLFGFTRVPYPRSRPVARSKPLIVLAKSGDYVTKTSTDMRNAGLHESSTMREKLVKIGARIVRHGRYVVFQLAEVAGAAVDVREHPAADR